MREYIVGREASYSGSGILYERLSRESPTMEEVARGSVSALRDLAKKLNAAEDGNALRAKVDFLRLDVEGLEDERDGLLNALQGASTGAPGS